MAACKRSRQRKCIRSQTPATCHSGFTVTTDLGETQVGLTGYSIIQVYQAGTQNDLSTGNRISVIVLGDLEGRAPVDAASVTLNPPEPTARFGAGGLEAGAIGGRGGFRGQDGVRTQRGFGGVLNGTIGTVSDNSFTVVTDSVETQVNLTSNSVIQVHKEGTLDDLSRNDRVLVIFSGEVDRESPIVAASVIVNPPGRAGAFGGPGFGDGPPSP